MMIKLHSCIIAPFFVCVLQLCTAQYTFYVSSNGTCADDLVPCATLSDYNEMVRNSSFNNIMLVLLSGRHVLDGSNFEISDAFSFTMVTELENVEVVCIQPLQFVLTDITYVNISAVAFISCGLDVTSAFRFELSNCKFQDSKNDSAVRVISSSFIVMKGNYFTNNSATNGGAIYLESSDGVSTGNFESNTFVRNSASIFGGAIHMVSVNATFSGTHFFEQNSAILGGGAIFANRSTLISGTSMFIGNSAYRGGAMHLFSSSLTCTEKNLFHRNVAILLGGAIMLVSGSNCTFEGTAEVSENSAEFGGGIYSMLSGSLNFNGDTVFTNNTAMYGGGMLIIFTRTVRFSGNTCISENKAQFGGGIGADSSNFIFTGHTDVSLNVAFQGAGVFAVANVTLSVSMSISFVGNLASDSGGGLFLSAGSQLFFNSQSSVSFTNNTAQRGGAIQIEDSTAYVYCFQSALLTECFFQFTPKNISPFATNASLNFDGNSAAEAGGDVFGGSIDSCFILDSENTLISGGAIFDKLAASEGDLDLSSEPIRICACDHAIPNCDETQLQRELFPGETIHIEVIALGQKNGSVPALIQGKVTSDSMGRIREVETAQQVDNICTNVSYTILSGEELLVEIDLYPDGPCLSTLGNISISLRVLSCPIGFEFSTSEQVCICDTRLLDIESTIVCDINTLTIRRKGNLWMGFDEEKGLMLHSLCPFDYCISKVIDVPINNSDVLCSGNRVGILCGKCRENFSLSLGSSQCRQCSNAYLALLIPFALAGLALVGTLFILKLTVAEGTLSGLAFYANVVGYNTAFFFPQGKFNILRVFISWINLDFGIESCFFDGMDTYSAAWLQFVFPIYVWLLAGGLIVVSHFHASVSRMLGSNPIAVLATLFLLSFTKILSAVSASLDVYSLQYPNDTEVVWARDGNIAYFSGKHVPLALVALAVLLLIIFPYTITLFLGQWIQSYRVCGWMSNPRIKSFFDAYYAPYTSKHRYWPGLLLVLRGIILTIFSFNSDLEGVPYTVITIICLGLTALLNAGIYKKWYISLLEASFVVNLGALAVATGNTRDPAAQTVIVSLSVSIAAIEFIGIIIYHSFLQFGKQFPCVQIANAITNIKKHDSKESNPEPEDVPTTDSQPSVPVTEVNLSLSSDFSRLREPLLDYFKT